MPPTSIARPARQARSRDTEARILEALRSLLAEKPLDAISVQEMAGRAGVSVGGFYARFASKNDALLHMLYAGYVAEVVAEADEVLHPARWQAAPAAEVILAHFRMLVNVSTRHEAVVRELVRRTREAPGTVESSEAWARFRERVHAPFRALLEARTGEMAHPDPALAITVGFAACSSAIREALLFGHMQPSMGGISTDQLVAEIARMFCAYLGVALPAARP